MSRLWGYLNSLELPVCFRPMGVFGCNLKEIEPSDLRQYTSLGDFFYRKFRDGIRPIDGALLVRAVPTITVHTDMLDLTM
jgi:phosphatidylserine decarboxylase